VTPEAEERLQDWRWPGNVRELKNVIERACLLCEGHLLTERDVHRALQERPRAAVPARRVPNEAEEPQAPPPNEREVREALDETSGNKSLAARRLGVSRRTLYRLIEKYEDSLGMPLQ
jgi:DNA-binding NtrC family response regulator